MAGLLVVLGVGGKLAGFVVGGWLEGWDWGVGGWMAGWLGLGWVGGWLAGFVVGGLLAGLGWVCG
jgi:hypothetical protein